MTRQCAWCECYLASPQLEMPVTHGICDSCAEQLRRSLPSIPPHVRPRWEEMLHSTKATLGKVLHLR
jgi:hypothetical protein